MTRTCSHVPCILLIGLAACTEPGPGPGGGPPGLADLAARVDLAPPDDLDYSIPDGDRQRADQAAGDAGTYALPDCGGVVTLSGRDLFYALVQPRCAGGGGCHNAGAGGFTLLTDADLAGQWVGRIAGQSYKLRVAPRDPVRSYVVDKVLGQHAPPPAGVGSGSGGRMPLNCAANGTCLSEDEACLIINWIRAGAT